MNPKVTLQLALAVALIPLSIRSQTAPATPPDFVTAVTASKPLAYYRLDATAAETDAGAYEAQGGASVGSACAPIGISGNQCIVLDGKTGWIRTTQKGGIAGATTILAWVNVAQLPSKGDHNYYVAGISEVGNDLDLQLETDDTFRFFTSGGGSLAYKPIASLLTGHWHMLVATFDTNAQKRAIYWDGRLVAHDNVAAMPDKKEAFSIGNSTYFTERFFNGSIDEVALWDRAVSPAEVASIYQAAKSSAATASKH